MPAYERTYSMSGWRQVQRQIKRENDYIKSLPLPIRKAIKARDAALATYGAACIAKKEHAGLVALRAAYDALRIEADKMIEEYHND